MKRLILAITTGVVLSSAIVLSQSRGTPSQIRVNVDANGSLVVASAMQVSPVTQQLFSNARLAVDSSGNLLVVCSGCGGGGAPTDATYITQTSNSSLTNEQALGSLATGMLKSTTSTGVVSIAAVADVIALWSGTCNSTSFMSGSGVCVQTIQLNALTDTWNNGATQFCAICMNVTNTSSAANSRLLEVQIGSAPIFSIYKEKSAQLYNAFTSLTDFEGGGFRWESNVLKLGTTKGSGGGTARDIYLETPNHTGGGGWLFIDASGATGIPSSITSNNPFGVFGWASKGGFSNANADGVIRMMNNAGNGFGRLIWGSNDNTYPAIKRSGTKLQVRLGDDSDFGTYEGKYSSSDGTAGFTGTCTILGLTSIIVKDGLITGCS